MVPWLACAAEYMVASVLGALYTVAVSSFSLMSSLCAPIICLHGRRAWGVCVGVRVCVLGRVFQAWRGRVHVLGARWGG